MRTKRIIIIALVLLVSQLSLSGQVTLDPVSITSNNAISSSLAKVGNVVTLSFTSSEAITGVSVTIAGNVASVTNDENNWTATYTMDGSESEGLIPFEIDYSENAGSAIISPTDGSSVLFDKTPPSVLSIIRASTNPTDQNYVNYTVTFSKDVTGVSSSNFSLSGTGTFGASINTVSGSGSTRTVTVQTGTNGTLKLDLNQNIETIIDAVGNELDDTFESGEEYSVEKDGPEVVSINRYDPVDEITNGSTVVFRVTFNESVTGVNSWNFSLNASDVSGTINEFFNASGTTVNVTVSSIAITNSPNNGTLRLDLINKAGIQNSSFNELVATHIGDESYTIDQTPPTVSIGVPSASPVNSSATVNFPITYTGASSVNLTSGNVSITHSGTAGGTVNVQNGSTNNPTVQVSGVTGDGSYTISIAPGTSSDAAGNTDAGAGPSGAVTVDNTPPTVSIGTPTPSIVNSSATVSFPITYTGASSVNLTSGNVSINHSGTAGGTISVQNGSTSSPTVQVSGVTGDGSYTITIAAGRSSDAAGNTDTGAGPSGAVNVDNTPPTVSIGAPSASPVNSSATVNFPITYTGANNFNLTSGNVSITHSGTAGGTVNVQNGGTNNPTVQVSGVSGDGSYTISIASGTSSDAAGNTDIGAGPSSAVTVDNIPPTVSIGVPSASPVNSSATVNFPITYTGASSVNLTSGNVSINHSGTAGGTVNVQNGGTNNPTVQVSDVTGNGSYTITIAPGTSSDAAGNTDIGAGPSGAVDVDNTTTPPILIYPEDGSTVGPNIMLRFELPEEALPGSVKAKFQGGTDRILTFSSDLESQGTHEITLNGNSFTPHASIASSSGSNSLTNNNSYPVIVEYRDMLGNPVATSNSVTITFTSDPLEATIRSIPNHTKTAISKMAVGFNRIIRRSPINLTPFVLHINGSEVPLSGSIVTYNPRYTQSADSIYINLTDFTALEGNYTFTVLPGTDAIVDWGDNKLIVPKSISWTMDLTPPELSNIQFFSAPSPTWAKIGSLITLEFNSNEPLDNTNNPISVKIAGNDADAIINTGGNSWRATYTMTGTETEGPFGYEISCYDLAGNQTTASAASGIVFDRTPPSFSPLTMRSNNPNPLVAKLGDEVTIDFTANEPIENLLVTLGGNTIDTVYNISGNRWAAKITITSSFSEGVLSFSIDCYDRAGNDATITATSDSKYVLFDNTPPSIENITIVSDNDSTYLAKVGDQITISFNAVGGEALTNVSVVLNGVRNATPVYNTGLSQWEATYTMTSSDTQGVIAFTINYMDLAGNSGSQRDNSGLVPGNQVTFDRLAPSLSSVTISAFNPLIGSASTRAGEGSTITLSFESNEPIKTPTVTICGNSADVTVSSGDNINWTAEYTVVDGDPEGPAQFLIVYEDLAGNAGIPVSARTLGPNVVVDLTKPTLFSISIESDNIDYPLKAKTGSLVTLEFIASETITEPSITINGWSVHSDSISNSGNVWEALYTVGSDPDGSISFLIEYLDLAGNQGDPVSTPSNPSQQVVVDNTPPWFSSVSITSSNAINSLARVGDVITLSLTSVEPLKDVTAEVVSGKGMNLSSNTPKTEWVGTYIMQSLDPEGNLPIYLSYSDLTGNTGAWGVDSTTTDGTKVRFDRTPPTLTLVTIESNNTSDTLAKTGDTITLTFHANEGLTNVAAYIRGNLLAPTPISGSNGRNWTATYVMKSTDTEGEIPFEITYRDSVGNIGTPISTTTNSSKVIFDRTNPTLHPVTIASNNSRPHLARTGNTVTLSFTASEVLMGATARIAGKNAIMSTSDNKIWTATYTMVAEDTEGVIPFEIEFTDLAGNTQSALVTSTSNGSSVTFDRTPPAITDVEVEGGIYKIGNVITVSFKADANNHEKVTLLVNGKDRPLVNIGEGNYLAHYTVVEGDNTILYSPTLPVSIVLSDQAGNTNTSITAANVVGGSITIRSVVPVIDNFYTTADDPNTLSIGQELRFTLVPSEAQTGLTITPQTYNGKPLTWVASSDSSRYEASYVVAEGDPTQTTPLQLPTITITDNAGNVSAGYSYTNIQQRIFATKPTARILGTTTRCEVAGQTVPVTFELTGYKPFSLTYSNGTSTMGPIIVDDYTYQIAVEDGIYTLVNLTDSSGNSTVTAINEATITVAPLPILTLIIVGSPFNAQEQAVDLVGFATPPGGTFDGDGVTARGVFHPRMIEAEIADVPVEITYHLTDAQGCSDSIKQTVIVTSGGAVIESLSDVYCQYHETDTVYGSNNSNIPGVFNVSTPPNTWEDKGDNVLVISPQLMNAGTHYIYYSFIDSLGNEFQIQRSFIIDSVGVNVNFIGLNNQYCENASDASLQAIELYPAGGMGTFTGPTIGFSTISGSNAALFQPQLVEKEVDHQISYYYTSPNNCRSATITKTVRVNPLPDVDFEIRDNYNSKEDPILLTGNYAGGTFTGTGIISNTLYPYLVTAGSTINILYSHTDANQCYNSITKSTQVLNANEVIVGLENTYCFTTETIPISCVPQRDSTIVGTFESRRGAIVSTDGNHANYSIGQVGNNVDTVFYRYSIGATPYEVSTRVVVDSIGNVTISGLPDGFCEYEGQTQIHGLRSHPQGTGNFSYTGSPLAFSNFGNNAFINPSLEAVGAQSITFTYTSSVSGCTSSITHEVAINPRPAVSIDIPKYYNSLAETFNLIAEPSGGIFSGDGVIGALFNPSIPEPGPITIIYSYTDSNQCVNSKSEVITLIGPNATISGIPSNGIVCIDQVALPLTGASTNGYPGWFEGEAITNISSDSAIFNPNQAGEGPHTITYTYLSNADSTTVLSVSRTITVDNPGVAEISNFNAELTYCQNDMKVELFGFPTGGSFSGNGFFMIGNEFYPNLASVGVNEVTYTYVKGSTGCITSQTLQVTINPIPDVQFDIEQICSELGEEPIQFVNSTQSADEVVEWTWYFDGVGPATSTEFEPGYTYQSAGLKQVILQAVTSNGCASSRENLKNIGQIPNANFLWRNECLTGENTIFTSTSISEGSPIRSYRWGFPNGTINEGEDLNTVSHLFPEVESYNVSLVVESQDGCRDSIQKTVHIHPLIRIAELENSTYRESFESGHGHWRAKPLAENRPYTWALGTPTGDVFTSAASGSNAWYTNIVNKGLEEQSQVVSPCFDFSGVDRPMVKMNIWSSPVNRSNGTVLQYSTDGGVTWLNVGDLNSGVNWFNSASIESQPGGQITGWSSIAMDGWQTARNSLDMVKGANETNIRFRVAFASDGRASFEQFNGFAFDDIWIGNRNQNLLIEYFTNATLPTNAPHNSRVRNLHTSNHNDVIAIQYHTAFPSGDPLHSLYPDGSTTREFFYGISNVPYALVNGVRPLIFDTPDYNQDTLNIQMLHDPKFTLDVVHSVGSGLTVRVDITALQQIEKEDLVLFGAIVQKEVNTDQTPSNESTFYNVISGFAPDPGGMAIKANWDANELATFRLTRSTPSAELLSNGSVVVFLQNVKTRKVYQSAIIDLSGPTGAEGMKETLARVYPNPAGSIVNVTSTRMISGIRVLDITGRIIENHSTKGSSIELPVQHLKPGLYLLEIDYRTSKEVVRLMKK